MYPALNPVEDTHTDENFASAEVFFLQCLFKKLNKASLRYAIMRNFESLPFSTNRSDLDMLLVEPEDLVKVEMVIRQSIKEAGGVVCGIVRSLNFLKINAIGAFNPGMWWGQSIDVYIGLNFRGMQLLDETQWLQLTHRHNGISVLSDNLSGVLGVLKEVLNGNRLPCRYLLAARVAVEQDWDEMTRVLQPMGINALEMLRKMIVVGASKDDVFGQCHQIRHALKSQWMKTPLLFLRQHILYRWSKIHRYVSPSGCCIAVLGVDGVGKSTVINAIKPVLDAATHNAAAVLHLRPGLLPPLARLKSNKAAPPGPVLDPHGSKPSGVTGSILRLTYLMLDYIFGYWLRIRPKIAKQPAVIIFDRYAYDMSLDPQRFRIGLPGRVAGFFTKFAPRPDLIICLHAEPETIAARKLELPLEEIRRQVDTLRAFAKGQPNAVLISTENNIEEVRESVLKVLFTFFATKHREREEKHE